MIRAIAAVLFIVPVGLLVRLGYRLQFHWHWYPFQYLYFLRFPLLSALFLALFCLTGFVGTAPLQNLFVLEHFGIFLVSFVAVLSAWSILHSLRWLYVLTPGSLSLPLQGWKESDAGGSPPFTAKRNTIKGDTTPLHLFMIANAAPLLLTIAALSEGCFLANLFFVVLGVVMALLVRWVVTRPSATTRIAAALKRVGWNARWSATPSAGKETVDLSRDKQEIWADRWLECILAGVGLKGGKSDRNNPTSIMDSRSEELASVNMWIAVCVVVPLYGLFAFVLYPGPSNPIPYVRDEIPALIDILLLQILLTWLLSLLSLHLDRYRVVTELAVLVIIAAVYRLPNSDHYYEILDQRRDSPPAITEAEYIRKWESVRPTGATPVLVAASGGGATAAAWSAMVLAGLQETFGDDFASSIALVSTVSGGSIGAMYYVECFDERSASHTPKDLKWAVQAASRSSLGAVAWGLTYPDFLRLFLPLGFKWIDRGWAVESRWREPLPTLSDRALKETLRDWSDGVAAGWRPAQIFNATLVETGARYLISPIALDTSSLDDATLPDKKTSWRGVDFLSIYPNADMRITTAARLSASFPYVTPVARPDRDHTPPEPYHVADGGYFDNFGVMSVVDFADRASFRNTPLVIQIRESGKETATSSAGSFAMEAAGPVKTILAVRSSSQAERGELELGVIRKANPPKVRPESVIFDFRGKAPLSWHLSDAELRRICAYWEAQCDGVPDAIAKVGTALKLTPHPVIPRELEGYCADTDKAPPSGWTCHWMKPS